MRVAVIGSRSLSVPDLSQYLPPETTILISGGAKGVDSSVRLFAQTHGFALLEFFPDYQTHGRRAPLIRNDLILTNADLVLAFWDGHSRGTAYIIKQCRARHIPLRVFIPSV